MNKYNKVKKRGKQMKKGKRIIVLFLCLLLVCNLTACNSKVQEESVSKQASKFYSLTIDGDKLYHSESEEQFIEIKSMFEDYISEYGHADYLSEELTTSYDYCTKAFIGKRDINTLKKSAKENQKKSELITKVVSIDLKSIYKYSYKDIDCYRVTGSFVSSLDSATDEFCNRYKLSRNSNYSRDIVVRVISEDGKWKVDKIVSIGERKQI